LESWVAPDTQGTHPASTVVCSCGHDVNVPQEAPQAFAKAIVDVDGYWVIGLLGYWAHDRIQPPSGA
jgi:hypothetical protein